MSLLSKSPAATLDSIDQAEEGADAEAQQRSPHAAVDALPPEGAQPSAEAWPFAAAQLERGGAEAVEAVGSLDLEPARAEEQVDEGDEQDQAEPQQERGGDARRQQAQRDREDDAAEHAEGDEVQGGQQHTAYDSGASHYWTDISQLEQHGRQGERRLLSERKEP